MQARITPILGKKILLADIQALYIRGNPGKYLFEILRLDYLHVAAGGYCFSAFSYDFLIRVAWA